MTRNGPSGDDAPSRALDDAVLTLGRVLLMFLVGVTAVYRFAVPQGGKVDNTDLFKDWGHSLDFFLFGLAVMGWWHGVGRWRLYWYSAWLLALVELAAFVLEAWRTV